jgi:hypothetical protein
MLTFISGSTNSYTIRTSPTASNVFTMSLQDMTTQVNSTASLTGITYNGYESLLGFTASIGNTNVAQEFRATLLNGPTEIWHGSIQVFTTQSNEPIYKSVYANQIPLDGNEVSHVSTNQYVILD